MPGSTRAQRDAEASRHTPAAERTVSVALGSRSYDILIGEGLIERAGALIAQRLPKARAAIVADANTARLYGERLAASLTAHKLLRAPPIVVSAGEPSKSFATLETVCRALLASGLERNDVVVALGGGVIGDLAGFAASIVRRGVRMVQVPTTLLAQVDSSVGGKTGINTPEGKNLIGTFHQPSLVLTDTSTLATLPVRELRAGYAEVAKYGLLGDCAFFEWLEGTSAGVLSGKDAAARAHTIETCCRMKAGIVARDETETGERALLNLGHTFGHALEAATGYSQRLLHGEAVAVGMALAFAYSEQARLCPAGSAARVVAHLQAAGLPTRIADVDAGRRLTASELIASMRQDKKVAAGLPTLILARDLGAAFVSRDQTWEQLGAFLDASCR